jgi:uncharacterized protein (DUF58 family)
VSLRRNRTAMMAVLLLAALAVPLFAEFFEPGQIAWNVFLGVSLATLVVAAVFLGRFFACHAGEIGEARFDTTNRGDARG